MVYHDHGREKSMYVAPFPASSADLVPWGRGWRRIEFLGQWIVDGLADCVCLVYFINFGPHGPRAQRRKDGWEIFGMVTACIAASFTIFWVIRQYRIILNRFLLTV
jgi:hypothetical protein